jgi:familyl 116 glycosyl hydrolase-like protein
VQGEWVVDDAVRAAAGAEEECDSGCACNPRQGAVEAPTSDDPEPKYQFGTGCLTDQLIGQWAAHCAGLGYLVEPDHAHQTMASIFNSNFRETLRGHTNPSRVYAVGDDAGLLTCTWPDGGRPLLPFPYADEIWSGIEYQAAAGMIFEGLVDEGLTVVQGIADRHAGWNRNPWDQMECGHWYARALASWSVKLALDGFSYSVPEQRLGFAPRMDHGAFSTFWSTGTAWGQFTMDREAGTCSLEVLHGRLELADLALAGVFSGSVTVDAPGAAEATVVDGAVRFAPALVLEAGDTATIHTR